MNKQSKSVVRTAMDKMDMETLTFNVLDRYNSDKEIRKVQVISLVDACALLDVINGVLPNQKRATIVLDYIGNHFDDFNGTIYLKSPILEGWNGVYLYDNENYNLFKLDGKGIELIYIDSWALEILLQDFCNMSNNDAEDKTTEIFNYPRTMFD